MGVCLCLCGSRCGRRVYRISLGKMVEGHKLLALFALLMTLVAALMLRRRTGDGDASVRLHMGNSRSLSGSGSGLARFPDSSGSEAAS